MPPAPKKRAAASGALSHPPTASKKQKGIPKTPAAPEDAAPINIENKLHILPPETKAKDFSRPWFLYDWVDPAAKFRRMGEQIDRRFTDPDVSEGEDDGAILDDPEEGAIPISVPGYVYVHKLPLPRSFFLIAHRQRFVVDVAEDEKDKPWFACRANQTCKVTVRSVIWNAAITPEERSITTPEPHQLLPAIEYKVPAGYRRVIECFMREIRLMTEDRLKTHNCLFRATYLVEILDCFAEELGSMTQRYKKNPTRFRSRVFNPLLQRQLRGAYDQEPTIVKLTVGKTPEDAADFYLRLDPLHPKNADMMLRGILYIWPVRFSIALGINPATEGMYKRSMENTKELLRQRSTIKDEDLSDKLYKFEVTLIVEEGLTDYYEELIKEAVSFICLFIGLQTLTCKNSGF